MFKEVIRVIMITFCVLLGVALIGGLFYLVDKDEEKHIYSCSICGSTNISRPYEDRRGFLSRQKVYYCYKCNTEHNISLMDIEYKGSN